MSSGKTSGSHEQESGTETDAHHCVAANFVSSIVGVVTIAKYRLHGQIIEVETAIIKADDPAPDLSAGWNVIEKFDAFLRIQRVLG